MQNRIRFTKNEERLNQFYFDRFVAFSKGQLNNATLYSQHCPTHDDALSGDEDSSSSSFSTVFGELSYLDAYWPPFNVTSQCIKLIQPNFGIRCLPKADICPLWDSIGYDPFPEGEN